MRYKKGLVGILIFISIDLAHSIVKDDKDCKSWCVTHDEKKCSGIMNCGIEKRHDWHEPTGHTPPPKPTDFHIQLKCDNKNISDIKLGLLVSWRVRGDFIRRGLIKHFVLLLEDLNFQSDTEELIKIVVPNKINKNKYIQIEYFYHKTKDTFEIQRNGRYHVYLFSEPRTSSKSSQDMHKEEVVSSYYEDHVEGCKAVNNTTEPAKPESQVDNKYLMISIPATIFALLLIALIIVCKISYKKKDERTERNVFIFFNPRVSDNDDLKEETYRFSTIISKQEKFNVRFNLENNTTNDRILQTMQSNIQWADIVLLISIPDESDFTEEQYIAANNAIVHCIEAEILNSQNKVKEVIVVHRDKLTKYTNCPFLKIQKTVKIRVYKEEWKKLYKHISASQTEYQDLENQSLIASDNENSTMKA